MGMPAEKSLNFGPSARRLLRRMRPERLWLAGVIAARRRSVCCSASSGPKILGDATNIIFDGIISRQLPAGITQQQAVDGARAAGNDTFADMLAAMSITPGQGIDFAALGRMLLLVLALYVLASVFGYLQGYILNGVVQRTILPAARGGRGQAQPAAAVATWTATSAVRCSAGSPTTSTTSRSPCSRPCPRR